MSFSPWLPPLNVPGRPTQTTVKICQANRNVSDRSLSYPTMYSLTFHAYIDFVSDSNNSSTRQKNFPGLAIDKTLNVTCVCWLIKEILHCFPTIDSDENRGIFSEKFLDEDESRYSELFSGAQKLFHNIKRFMHDVVNMGHKNENLFFFDLDIRMEIVIPDDELKSWHSWFDAKKLASDPYFRLVYALDICRPRTEEELLAEDVRTRRSSSGSIRFEAVEVGETSAQSCSICLDDISVGCKVIKLPCGHLFDENCIRKWLQENKMCPVCQFDVQSSPCQSMNK